jgi:hypothetical protein
MAPEMAFFPCGSFWIRRPERPSWVSEEALESSNKDVRNYCAFLSRKCDHIPNLTDVFNRLFIRSDPVIRYIITRSQSKREKKATNTNVMAAPNEDDVLLSKILV